MKPALPEELSALIDGELDDARARELEAQMRADPSLRAEYDALKNVDAVWRAAGASAAFTPAAPMPKNAAALFGPFAAMALCLLGLKVGAKMSAETVSIGVHVIALGALLGGVIWLAQQARDDRGEAAMRG